VVLFADSGGPTLEQWVTSFSADEMVDVMVLEFVLRSQGVGRVPAKSKAIETCYAARHGRTTEERTAAAEAVTGAHLALDRTPGMKARFEAEVGRRMKSYVA
jgi:hypothetical protein